MTLKEKIETKNLEIQSVLFNEKDTFLIRTNIPKKLQELIGLIKSIESNSREFKNWVKENSIFPLEESINNCKKCYNNSKANTITRFFLETTVENCKKLSVAAVDNLYSTAEFFEVAIACHPE